MKQILVIGAGRSAVILIDYLLNESSKCGWIVTIADYNLELAKSASLNQRDVKVFCEYWKRSLLQKILIK